MSMWTLGIEGLSENMNKGKELLIHELECMGYLTSEQATDIVDNFAFLVFEKGTLGRLVDKAVGIGDEPIIKFIKVNIRNNPKKEKEEDVHKPTDSD